MPIVSLSRTARCSPSSHSGFGGAKWQRKLNRPAPRQLRAMFRAAVVLWGLLAALWGATAHPTDVDLAVEGTLLAPWPSSPYFPLQEAR